MVFEKVLTWKQRENKLKRRRLSSPSTRACKTLAGHRGTGLGFCSPAMSAPLPGRTLADLDGDVLAHCARHLCARDVASLAMACRPLHAAAYCDAVWYRLYRSPPSPPSLSLSPVSEFRFNTSMHPIVRQRLRTAIVSNRVGLAFFCDC
jgi:hypothetical protein